MGTGLIAKKGRRNDPELEGDSRNLLAKYWRCLIGFSNHLIKVVISRWEYNAAFERSNQVQGTLI